MSPSLTTYSLPSERSSPFSLAAATLPPHAIISSKLMVSARMKPRSMSEWILPAACGARVNRGQQVHYLYPGDSAYLAAC